MAHARGLHPPAKVADYRSKGWWGEQTLDGIFADQVRARGDALAVVDPANREALLGLVRAPADLAGARRRGGRPRRPPPVARPPSAATCWESSSPTRWSSSRSISRRGGCGVVVSPLPVQLREREVATMCARAGVTAYVSCGRFGDRALAADAATALADVDSVRAVVAYGPEVESADVPIGVRVWHPGPATEGDRDAVEAYAAGDPNEANDAVTICWTSGTESAPKGVPRCHMDWLAVGIATTEAPQVTTGDVLLNPFPMINMAGISEMFLPVAAHGERPGAAPPLRPADVPRAGRRRASHLHVHPPALLWMLLGNEELMATVDVSSLTRIGSGSAPLQPAMVRGWQERHGISVINFLGPTRGSGCCRVRSTSPTPRCGRSSSRGSARPGSRGRPERGSGPTPGSSTS